MSLGDVITLTTPEGAYHVESKSGHRTIPIAIQDEIYAHDHEDLHGTLTEIGVLAEFLGHAHAYCAVDIVRTTRNPTAEPRGVFGAHSRRRAVSAVDSRT